MGIFNRKPAEPPVDDGCQEYDYQNQGVWDFIADVVKMKGYEMKRGSGSLGHDKWGDGKYHLKFRAKLITKKPSNIGLFIDNVPFSKAAWNALSDEERLDMVTNHVVQFKPKTPGEDVTVSGS